MHGESLAKILTGFKNFRDKYFKQQDYYQDLRTNGQTPHSLIITCSDSRVDPSILFQTHPGEIFVVRNVANLVPPYETGGGYHGVSAAIEFAVLNIKVKNVIVLGHRQCGGIRNLMETSWKEEQSFVRQWMKIAESAKKRVIEAHPESDLDEQCLICEKEAIRCSITNLLSFPFIQEKLAAKEINILGLYFDLELGHLQMLSSNQNNFDRIG